MTGGWGGEHSLAELPLHHQVGAGAGESGRAPDTGGVADAQGEHLP